MTKTLEKWYVNANNFIEVESIQKAVTNEGYFISVDTTPETMGILTDIPALVRNLSIYTKGEKVESKRGKNDN